MSDLDFKSWAYTSPVQTREEPTHRHKKRGSEYVLIGYGKVQSEEWFDGKLVKWELKAGSHAGAKVDMREVAIYRSVDDGSLWVRPREEFEDGRFEALSQPEPKGDKT
jgi:hypothetical protein